MAPPPMLNWLAVARRDLTEDVFELKLKRPDGFNFRAGQYISIVVPGAGPGGRNLRRAYSIASPSNWSDIEFCVKLVDKGPGTKYLNSVKIGEVVQGQAPFGDFCLNHDQQNPTLFIGTGTGIAPLRGMVLSDEWQAKGPVGFLLGVRSEKDILYPELFGAIRPKVLNCPHVQIALSRPTELWKGFRGRVTDYIKSMEWDFLKSHYYLCGSGAMIQEVRDWLMKIKNVAKVQIHSEKYF